MQPNTKVKAGQTLIDIAIQNSGTADSLFLVAALNGMSITDELQPGQLANTAPVVAQSVVDYFRRYGIYPASSVYDGKSLAGEGVGYWAIGFDFIVSPNGIGDMVIAYDFIVV